MKHIVCYSGGHSSALVAVEVVRKFGKENVILLNHDISATVEDQDIKRFKNEVAEYLGMEVTYANYQGLSVDKIPDQFEVSINAKGFKFGVGSALCTTKLKTEPFMKYLKDNFPEKDCICYYGFDPNETVRIQRRVGVMSSHGYRTGYPLAHWKDRTIHSVEEIGIKPPNAYSIFKHSNCTGCLKAGRQHWYATYVTRPDLFEKAKEAEEIIGYTIIKDISMLELEEIFAKMKKAGIAPDDRTVAGTFWKNARKAMRELDAEQEDFFIEKDEKPCECVF